MVEKIGEEIVLQKIQYGDLNSRQKENYNFQKLSALLADYGFNSMWLNDDWLGADFIACHIDGVSFLKVQLKGRFTIDKKYNGKDIYIAFVQDGKWYLYPHDKIQAEVTELDFMKGSISWEKNGTYNWPSIPKKLVHLLEQYAI